MPLKVLSLSDILLDFIYSPHIARRFSDVDLVISCGDLPYYYLEYVISSLDVPLLFVRGNHASPVEHTVLGPRTGPQGAVDLHGRTVYQCGLLLAGVEGSLRYREGPFQYSQFEMWALVLGLVPSLMLNRAIYGRYLDIFVSHAPPWGIHDQDDPPHQGIKPFRWLLKVFRPAYHFHGHIHIYRSETPRSTLFEETVVINTYGYTETIVEKVPSGLAPLEFLDRKVRTGRATQRGVTTATPIKGEAGSLPKHSIQSETD